MNSAKPKISVVVPVYNVEKYLVRCLDSLINQTLEELEIIVVNDGSTDNSQMIIDEYLNKFPQIKSINKENGGLSDARNSGLDIAVGEYIAFVDSDDWVDLQMMQKMYDLGKKHSAEIVICDLEKVNEKGKVFRRLPQSPQLPEKIILEQDFTIFGEMECFACNKLFKRELFNSHRFKKGIHFEDIELIPQLLLNCNTIAKTNNPFYKYFERQGSITRTHTKKGLDMFLAIDTVNQKFTISKYAHKKQELRNFQTFQGFYCYLAYLAYVKEKAIKKEMLVSLRQKMKNYGITRTDIFQYKRFGKNYLVSLNAKKKAYYLFQLLFSMR